MYCTKCGAQNDNDAKFCGSCGSQMEASAQRKCPDCGTPMKPTETFCSKCGKKYVLGERLSSDENTVQKSKTTAIMLAFFVSFFSYLYTYRVNYLKFLIGLTVMAISTLIAINGHNEDQSIAVGLLGTAFWIFSLIDNAVRSSKFYSRFPASSTEGKSKSTAVTLSFLFGPFGLIYTWKRDWWKFLLLVSGTLAIHAFYGYAGGENSYVLNILPWLITIVLSIARQKEFYEDYKYTA